MPFPSAVARGPFNRSTQYAAVANRSQTTTNTSLHGMAVGATGVMVIGQWKNIVTVSGTGIFYCAAHSGDATVRTVSVSVVLDGVELLTATTTTAAGVAAVNVLPVYALDSSVQAGYGPGIPLPFLSSMVLRVKNDTDTTSTTFSYCYMVST